MTPFATDRLLPTLRECHRTGMAHAPTRLLADLAGCAERTARLYLALMEQRGLVERRGAKGGWRVAAYPFTIVRGRNGQAFRQYMWVR